ncbi:MAG: peptidoglycan-binding protein [Ferrimicrobium sp.]
MPGIDIASFQHPVSPEYPDGAPIDYASTAAALRAQPGECFAIAKATESADYTNPWFAKDLEGFRAEGILVAAYHFVHAGVDAAAQVAFVRSVVPVGCPIWLDAEQGGLDGHSATELAAVVEAMIADLGTAGVYTDDSLYPALHPVMGDLPLWLADPANLAPQIPRAITQTGVVSLAGIAAGVDADTLAADVTPEQLSAMFWFSEVVLVSSPPEPVVVHEAAPPEPVAVHEAAPTPTPDPIPQPQPEVLSMLPEISLTNPMTHSAHVQIVQVLLHDVYGVTIATDGWYGPVTEGAVKGYQAKVGIAVDGVVGPVTWMHLLGV